MPFTRTRSADLLVVDSDTSARNLALHGLRREGLRAVGAGSRAEAIRIAAQSSPTLALSALDLVDGDGLGLLGSLKASHGATVPVILVGQVGQNLSVDPLALGAEDLLGRPLFVQDLVTSSLLHHGKAVNARIIDGHLEKIPAIRLLRSLCAGLRSGRVVFLDGEGEVSFRRGRIIDAVFRDRSGEAALLRLLTLSCGPFHLSYGEVGSSGDLNYDFERLLRAGLPYVGRFTALASKLPTLEATLEISFAGLAAKLKTLPDGVNGLLRLFDGKRSIDEVLRLSPLGELTSMEVVGRLLRLDILGLQQEGTAASNAATRSGGPGGPGGLDPTWAFGALAQAEPGAPAAVMLPHALGVGESDATTTAGSHAGPSIRDGVHAEGPAVAAQALMDELFESQIGVDGGVGAAGRTRAPIAGLTLPVGWDEGEDFAWQALESETYSAGSTGPERAVVTVAEGAAAIESQRAITAPDLPSALRALAEEVDVLGSSTLPKFEERTVHQAGAQEAVVDPGLGEAGAALEAAEILEADFFAVAEVHQTPVPERRHRGLLGRLGWGRALAVLGLVTVLGALVLYQLLALPSARPPAALTQASSIDPAPAAKVPAPAAAALTAAAEPEVARDEAWLATQLQQGQQNYDAGNYADAILAYSDAIVEYPKSVPARIGMGLSYMEFGDLEAAVDSFQGAESLAPHSGRVVALLGTALQLAGRRGEARQRYRQYLKLHPAGPNAREIQRILATW